MPSDGTKQEPTPTALLTNVQKPRKISQYNPARQHLRNSQNQSIPRSLKPPPTPLPSKPQRPNLRKAAAFSIPTESIPFKFPVNRSARIQRNHIIIALRPGSRPRTSQGKHHGEAKSASSLPAPKSASRGGRGSTGGGTPASGEPVRRRNRRESTAARGIRRFGSCGTAGGGGGRASET